MGISIRADSRQRTALDYFQAEVEFFRSLRLLGDKGIAALIPTRKIVGSDFAAQIAVEALISDIELPRDILRQAMKEVFAHAL